MHLSGEMIQVPNQVSTIQGGINIAQPGDTVLIDHGIYYENIILYKNDIIVSSLFIISNDSADIYNTIIDGQGGTVVNVNIPSSVLTKIIGLTIQNGDDGISGNSKFTVQSCIIQLCSDGADYEDGSGGLCAYNIFRNNNDDGIDLDNGVDIQVLHNEIINNFDDGIEIRLQPYNGSSINYDISYNNITGNGEDGIQLIDYPGLTNRFFLIRGNIFSNNQMVGVGCMANGNTMENYEGAPIPEQILLFNNTIDGNNYGLTGGANMLSVNNIYTNNNHTAVLNTNANSIIAYSLFYNNGQNAINSNINSEHTLYTNPLFVASYKLSDQSPCIDFGTDEYIWVNINYIINEDYFGVAPDLGAFESINTIPISIIIFVLLIIIYSFIIFLFKKNKSIGINK